MLARRVEEGRPAGEAALAVLAAEAAGTGICVDTPAWEAGIFAFQRDPFTGEDSLLARFCTGSRRGTVCLRPDGSLYAELDILKRHPADPALWIEAVMAWGRPPELKSEPRLMAMPQES